MYEKRRYYSNDEILKTGIVTRIEQQNKFVGERMKNVFYLQNQDKEDTMCIMWGRTCFKVGDEITCHGRKNVDGIIICRSYMIDKKAEGESV